MGILVDRIKQAGREDAMPSEDGAGVGQISEREQAIRDRYKSDLPSGSLFKKLGRGRADREIETRRQQRAYAEQPQTPMTAVAVERAREMLSNLGGRREVLGMLRSVSPEMQQEILRVAPGVAQQLGDDRGGMVSRALGAVSRGISHGVSQPVMEFTGLGGTPEEIEFIRQLDAAASQEFSPARPGDPWYERGPLQAAEMVPWMSTVVGGAGLGRAAATTAAKPLAAKAAAKAGMGRTALKAAGKTGELAGITAAAFPSQYAQEVDQLKEMGIEEGLGMRLLAGGTAAVAGLIEGIVPNPFKTGKVPLTEGAIKAARQYLWEAAKKAPGEMSEEYLQGVTSGLGQAVASRLYENAEDKTIADAFANGWEQAKEAALPMAFLLGVPAVGGAGLSADRARRLTRLKEIRAKGYVSDAEAKEVGTGGKNRKERLANADKEIVALENEQQQASQETPPALPSKPPALPTTPPQLDDQRENLEDIGKAGGAIADNFYEGIRESLKTKGKVPSAERKSSVGRAWDAWEDKADVDGFVDSLRTQPPSVEETNDGQIQSSQDGQVELQEQGQEQGQSEEQQSDQEAEETQVPVATEAQWDIVKDGRKLYQQDPNAKTASERQKTRKEIDLSKGTVLVTKDDFGRPIPKDTLAARQEFADKAKPGAEFELKGFKGSRFKVQDDGQLLELNSRRVMGTVQERANQVAPRDVKWLGGEAESQASQPETKWQSEARSAIESVPAFKGAKVETDETARTARVTRQDGLSTTIHFGADAELAKAAKEKGRDPNAIYGRYVRKPGATESDIYIRSDANHTNVLNHEVMHWLEDSGVVTKEEVDKHGGREGIANKYGEWAEGKQRKKDSVFQKIHDVLEPLFSAQRRFFEEVGNREASTAEEKHADRKKGEPEAKYRKRLEKDGWEIFKPTITQTKSPDLKMRDSIAFLDKEKFKSGDKVRVFQANGARIDGVFNQRIGQNRAEITLANGKVGTFDGDDIARAQASAPQQPKGGDPITTAGQAPVSQPSWSEQSQKNYVKQKRALTKAQGTKDPQKILDAANQGIESFKEFGEPDDWARWERAKEDAEQAIKRGDTAPVQETTERRPKTKWQRRNRAAVKFPIKEYNKTRKLKEMQELADKHGLGKLPKTMRAAREVFNVWENAVPFVMDAMEQADGPLTIQNISDSAGVTWDAAYESVQFLENKGIVERPLRNWKKGDKPTFVMPERAIQLAVQEKFPEISKPQLERALGLAEEHLKKHTEWAESHGIRGKRYLNNYGDSRLWEMKGRSIRLVEMPDTKAASDYLDDLDKQEIWPDKPASPTFLHAIVQDFYNKGFWELGEDGEFHASYTSSPVPNAIYKGVKVVVDAYNPTKGEASIRRVGKGKDVPDDAVPVARLSPILPTEDTKQTEEPDKKAIKDLVRKLWTGDEKPKKSSSKLVKDKRGQGLIFPEMKKELDRRITIEQTMRYWQDAIEAAGNRELAEEVEADLKTVATYYVDNPPKAVKLSDEDQEALREVIDNPEPKDFYNNVDETVDEYLEAAADKTDIDGDTWEFVLISLPDMVEKAVRADLEKQLKPKKKRTKLSERAEAAKEKGAKSRSELYDAIRNLQNRPTMGLDMEVAALAVKAAKDSIEEGVVRFAAFVETVASEVPDLIDSLGPYLEAAWEVAGELGYDVDKAGDWKEHAFEATLPQGIPAYVISGMQRSPGRVGEQKLTGRPIGVAVGPQRMSDNVVQKIAAHVNRGGTLFVDSGMYGTVKQGEIGEEPDWNRVFDEYNRVLREVKPRNRRNVMLVAPDFLEKLGPEDPRNPTGKDLVVGDTNRTLELQQQHARTTEALMDQGARVIVPLQRDMSEEAMGLGEIASLATDGIDLASGNFAWGIPYYEAAWPDDQILNFVRDQKRDDGSGMHLHLLGGGKPRAEKLWNKIREIDPTVRLTGDAATEVRNAYRKEQKKESTYGTLENPNRVELGKHFQEQLESGADYKSIVEARKEAAELIGGKDAKIEPGTPAAKAVDEAVEQGIVRAAREMAEFSSDPLEVYDSLLDLYNRQPRLNVRTGTSMRQQAYSTPAPAAWIASVLSDTKRDDIAYDSSAGNGMLLLGVDAENAIANELNPDRANALRELGYQVNQGDATEYTPEQQPDRIIINPPFGELEGKKWSIGGITTDKIDHAIVLKTLESLPEDGKAVLIIASKGFEKRQPKDDLRRGEAYKNDKNFYNSLYDGYNVTDHFTLHGDMYSKQGAAFPIDVIVIDGRGKSELPKPYQIDRQNAIPRVINNWQELRDVAERYLDTGTGRPSDLSTEQIEDDLDGFSGLLEEEGKKDVQGSGESDRDVGAGDDVSPRGGTSPSGARGSSGQRGVSESSEDKGDGRSRRVSGNDKASSTARSNQLDDSGSVDKVADVDSKETDFQATYEQRSKRRNVGTLVPTTHLRAVQEALDKAEDRYGDLDEFVAEELGYTLPELDKYFSAEQVDALALTIARHKEGKAFVLGDQTGVGKGRVAAAAMVYAKRQGLVPVFMTEGADLYADMYRDLQDIGQHTKGEPWYALATNTLKDKDKIELPDGTVISQNTKFAEETFAAVANSVAKGDGPVAMITVEQPIKGKKTPSGKQAVKKVTQKREYDAVFTAYSQMQNVAGRSRPRHADMAKIAPNTFFVLDESHNAGGVRTTGRGEESSGPVGRAERVRNLLSESQGVLFLSATYAKNPNVMDLYAKTGMQEAIQGADQDLIETIVSGGLPLQQVLSEMLVESGTYLRREKSFKGIGFGAAVKNVGEVEAGEVAAVFDAINELDKIKNAIVKSKAFKKWLTAQGLGLGKDSATGKRGMESSTFSSILHNLVDQMLLSIKADAVADEAIASLERGEAPTIGLSNTAGSALDRYLEDFPADFGEEIEFRFNTTAQRYLERSRQIMLTDVGPDGKKTSRQVWLPDEVLGDEGMAAFRKAQELIDSFAADIPASPIDHIRNRIEEAGYTVAEVTGRKKMVDYSGGNQTLSSRPANEQGKGGKIKSFAGFNAGDIDVLILNQSGSTGRSAHASSKVANQKRRHMIIAQADKNIDTFMQMLGRINRTGQIEQHEGQPKGSNLPYYTLLMTNVPAEIRPASVLMKKLGSLNANVTADSKGSVSFDAPDILNVVGDRIVAEYVADHPQLNHALDDVVDVSPDGAPKIMPDIARKVSGLMAMRPIKEQNAFWDAVTDAYNEEITQLDKLGKNPLVATKMDLGARTLEKVEIFAGDVTADSPFLQPAYASRVRVKKQGEPMSPDEVKDSIKEFYGKDPSEQIAREWAAGQAEMVAKASEENAAKQAARLVNATAIANVRDRARVVQSSIRSRLNSFAPGMVVEFAEVAGKEEISNDVRGVVIDVKAKKGKEHLPSGWIATIALSSPDRVARVPFSRMGVQSGRPGDVFVRTMFEMANDQLYANWEEVGDVYEERIIGTGNLLAAFDQLVSEKSRGNIIFFTDEEGVSQRGVMMPRNFDLDKWSANRPVTFATPQQVLDFIGIDPSHQANDPNFAIQFTLDGGTMIVRSPRSRQRSGRYTTNQELIEASGTDFVSVGQILQMKVRGKAKQLAVIEAAQKLGPLIAANYKDDARGIADSGPNRVDVGAIHRTNTSAVGTPQQTSRADFSFTDAETPEGKSLLKKLQNDGVKRKIGPRSIMNYLKDVVRVGSIEGKSQLSRRSPGHYRMKEHLVRSRTGASLIIDAHEAGHALSALLRDKDPKILKRYQGDLVGLTQLPNSMASGVNAEEGMAEYVRRFIVDYQSIPEPLRTDLQGDIAMVSPELLAGLKDTNRLWQRFMARPLQERLDASKNDRTPRKMGRGFRDAVYRGLYNVIGGDVALHKVRRSLEKPLFKIGNNLGRQFRDMTTDSKADIESAYQSVIRVPVETQRAIFGDTRSEKQGVSIIAYGNEMLSEEDAEYLRDGGFRVPGKFKHGERVYLTSQSFEQIREKLGDDWDAFENYGQLRASLERWNKKGHQSAWLHEGTSATEASNAVADMEAANPEWRDRFDEVREFFDALLLVATLSGEKSAMEAVRIRNAWDSYWPLLRQVTEEDSKAVGKGGPDPSAGLERAFGSALPLRNLLESVELRTKAAMQAYYTNRMMLAMREYSNTLHEMEDAPFDIRKAGARLMMPLRMDMKRVASLSPEEQAQMIVEYLNKQMQKEAEESGEDLDPDDLYSVEEIDIRTWRPIYRSTRPNAIQVIGLTENGQRKYYQVTDPILFDLFSNSGSMSQYATWFARFFAKGIGPWKRALTQNLAFAARNIVRDPITGMAIGEGWKAYLPGIYTAYGVVNRLNGSLSKDAPARAELFSRSMESLHHPRHKKFWDNFRDSFKEAATEGLLIPNYWDMNVYDRISEAPGQLSAAALWPVTMFNWATGGRYVSQLSEELQREGAFVEARQRGRSYEYAQSQYDQISGNFSQRQPNHSVATFVRAAGFLNPGLQIMWGQLKRWRDPDPRARKLHLAKLPALAGWFSVASAINVALVYALYGDDDEKLDEVLNDMRERPDYEKDTTMSVMGAVRLPFEYGLSGAVSSFAWNATQDSLIGGSNDSIPKRLKAFVTRAAELPGPTDAIQPYLKTLIELNIGDAGFSFYRQDSIVPEQLMLKYPVNPEMRAHDDTSEIFKQIGKSLGVSPLKVEYAVGSLLTGTAKDLIEFGEKAISGETLKAEDFPVASRLLQRTSVGFRSAAIRDLRKIKQEAEAISVKIQDMGDAAPKEMQEKYAKLQDAALAYDIVSSMYDEVQERVEEAEADKSAVEETERQMTKFARQFLNYHAGKSAEPAQLKEHKAEYYGLKAYQATGNPASKQGKSTQDKAKAVLELSGMTLEEAKKALIKYYEAPGRSAYKMKDGRYLLKYGRRQYIDTIAERFAKLDEMFAGN